jgi:hypothetical protein
MDKKLMRIPLRQVVLGGQRLVYCTTLENSMDQMIRILNPLELLARRQEVQEEPRLDLMESLEDLFPRWNFHPKSPDHASVRPYL